MSLLQQFLFMVVAFYLVVLLFLYLQQKRLIFFPTRAKHHLTDPAVAEFSLYHNNSTLSGWLINYRSAAEKAIIYYGGNAEDIYYAIEQFRDMRDTAALLVHYRGYGTSSGSPGEPELLDDALAVYDEFRKRYSPRKVYLMGRSLGACVAGYVAANRQAAGVILITPFDSIEAIARRQFPFLPTKLLLHHKFSTIDYVQQYDIPTLVIYGGKDRIVRPSQTERLIIQMRGRKKVILIEEAEHNNIDLFDEYKLEILKFVQ